MNKQAFSKKIREANFRRWRKQHGVRLIVSVMPMTNKKKRAVALFEGRQYVGVGKTHAEALGRCFEAIKMGANLDE